MTGTWEKQKHDNWSLFMSPKVRLALTDLLDFSATANNHQWMAVLFDDAREPVIHPAYLRESVMPCLEAAKKGLHWTSEEPHEFSIPIDSALSGTDNAQPGVCTVVILLDSDGNRQGVLFAEDGCPREPGEQQKNSVARTARLLEHHIDAGAIDDSKRILEAQETQFSVLSEVARQTSNGVVVTDNDGLVTWVNRGFQLMTGYSFDESLGKKPGAFLQGEQTDPQTIAHMSDRLSKGQGFDAELINYTRDGRPYWIRIHCELLRSAQGAVEGFMAVQTDINAEKINLEKLQHSLRLNRAILNTLHDAVITTDIEGVIRTVNPALGKMFGYPENALVGEPITKLMPPEIARHHPGHMSTYAEADKPSNIMGNLRSIQGVRSDGTRFPLRIAVTETTVNSERLLVAALHDLSDIERLAFYDPLTNLPNRRLIRERLESSMIACSESGRYGAVLLTDLDDFKSVNDTLGHRSGDDLLIEVSGRFQENLTETDSLSRLGGDEFLFVLNDLASDPELALKTAIDTAQMLLESASQPSTTLDGARRVTSSMGLVLYRDRSLSVSELLRRADIAMYDAKRKGKNCVSVFDDFMQQKLLDDHELIKDLTAALENRNEIVTWFQPKVNETGEFTGFEALVRWQHPHRGLLNPGQFIELAETKNLIIPLGDLVLVQACERMSAWRQAFSIDHWTMAVNVSQSQLAMPDFPEKVEAILKQTGLPARVLQLEITESVVAENIYDSIEQMEQLRSIGVTFSLDDFGTGFSSLSYLRQLPIDELKIDRSFVENLLYDEEGYAIVQSILQLARSLNLSVVAEGIEKYEQWQILKELGCQRFQGYLFSRPQSPEDISTIIQQRHSGLAHAH
ncbi:MAG: EAL domain-containing protein [Marinobacter sp.]